MSTGRSVLMDDSWWAGNFDTISRRFKEWALV
jgi:putative spermidine/putrescine transport system substrate-binding protein